MAKKLSKNEVVNLARLARLKLSDVEIIKYQKDLNSILKYVEALNGVDTSGLEPTLQVTGLENVTRPDKVRKQLSSPEQLLSITPDRKDDYIKVHRMIK